MAATQDQINAYLYNIREAYISYGNNLANAQRLGRTDLSCYQMKFRLLQYFVRIMTDYFDSSNYETINFFTVDEVKEVFKKAAKEPYFQGILAVTEKELVSSDFKGDSHSATVDLPLTAVIGGNMVKVVAWYDNEWGYSNRLVEMTADVGKALQQA